MYRSESFNRDNPPYERLDYEETQEQKPLRYCENCGAFTMTDHYELSGQELCADCIAKDIAEMKKEGVLEENMEYIRKYIPQHEL